MITRDRRSPRDKRHYRLRRYLRGSSARPRLAVFRSLGHIYAQLVDDRAARTVASASDAELAEGNKTARANRVGKLLAERAKEVGVEQAVFDRGGRLYHGRVKALAEGAREAGLHI